VTLLRVLQAALLVAAFAFPAPDLRAQTGAVSGRVRDDEGSAVFGATVELQRAGVTQLATSTDRLGFFGFPTVGPGAWDLIAGGLGYQEVLRSFTVVAGEPVELDLRLVRRAIEVEGVSVDAERSRERIRFEDIGGATVREINLDDLRRVPGVA